MCILLTSGEEKPSGGNAHLLAALIARLDARCIFKNTTTLGVREYVPNRYNPQQNRKELLAAVRFDKSHRHRQVGVRREKAEYESCGKTRRENDVPLNEAKEKVYKNM